MKALFNNHMPFTNEEYKTNIAPVNTLRMYCTHSLQEYGVQTSNISAFTVLSRRTSTLAVASMLPESLGEPKCATCFAAR